MQNQGFNLSEQQMGFFRTFGYLSFPELMADRIEEIDREFEAVWAAQGGGHNGKPHNEKARSCIVPFIDQSGGVVFSFGRPAYPWHRLLNLGR